MNMTDDVYSSDTAVLTALRTKLEAICSDLSTKGASIWNPFHIGTINEQIRAGIVSLDQQFGGRYPRTNLSSAADHQAYHRLMSSLRTALSELQSTQRITHGRRRTTATTYLNYITTCLSHLGIFESKLLSAATSGTTVTAVSGTVASAEYPTSGGTNLIPVSESLSPQQIPTKIQPTEDTFAQQNVLETAGKASIDRKTLQLPSSIDNKYILLPLAVIVVLISGVWFAFVPDFESFLACITSITVIVSLIAFRKKKHFILLGALIGLLVLSGVGFLWFKVASRETNFSVGIRIKDAESRPIQGATVILLAAGKDPVKRATDSDGLAQMADAAAVSDVQLIVRADGFLVHQETLNLSEDRILDITLQPQRSNMGAIIVRVTQAGEILPIENATALLIVEGQQYSISTDKNGLAKFEVVFVNSTLDVALTVTAAGRRASNEHLTIKPNQLLEVQLTALDESINETPKR